MLFILTSLSSTRRCPLFPWPGSVSYVGCSPALWLLLGSPNRGHWQGSESRRGDKSGWGHHRHPPRTSCPPAVWHQAVLLFSFPVSWGPEVACLMAPCHPSESAHISVSSSSINRGVNLLVSRPLPAQPPTGTCNYSELR